MKRILAVIAATILLCVYMYSSAEKGEQIFTVELYSLQKTDIYHTIDTVGTIRELRTRSLGPNGYAVVDKIYVNVGDTVKKGQIIMAISTENVQGLMPDVSVFSNVMSSELTQNDLLNTLSSSFPDEAQSGYITSPFDGIVTGIGVGEGEQVSPFTVCANVSDMSRIQAVINIDEKKVSEIKLGMPVSVQAASSASYYSGVVIEISPKVTTSSSLLGQSEKYAQAVVEIYAPLDGLMPGASATASVMTSVTEGAITVPYEAVRQDKNNREYVFVLSGDQAVLRYITTGKEFNRAVEVTGGLAGTESILICGEELYNGTKVAIE